MFQNLCRMLILVLNMELNKEAYMRRRRRSFRGRRFKRRYRASRGGIRF